MTFTYRHLHSRLVSFGISCAMLFACCGLFGANAHSASARHVVRLGREFKIRVGQQATLKGTKLRIKFASVKEDSRCPIDVKCIWAGNAAVRLQVNYGRSSEILILNTGKSPSLVDEVQYQGYKVKLVELSPYPRSDRKIAARQYTATLLVNKE